MKPLKNISNQTTRRQLSSNCKLFITKIIYNVTFNHLGRKSLIDNYNSKIDGYIEMKELININGDILHEAWNESWN